MDIVERLRKNFSINDSRGTAHMALQAADEIERLRAALKSLDHTGCGCPCCYAAQAAAQDAIRSLTDQ